MPPRAWFAANETCASHRPSGKAAAASASAAGVSASAWTLLASTMFGKSSRTKGTENVLLYEARAAAATTMNGTAIRHRRACMAALFAAAGGPGDAAGGIGRKIGRAHV